MATKITANRQSFNLRLPPELHEQLRIHSFLTGTPINETLTKVVTAWMEGEGHQEMVDASTKRTQALHRPALDKLRDL
ncbi:DNA-binding protein [Actinopolymorpha pittospori]|uniref:HicB family protein n=1 Tax=Actinopolymorpha pittospori TaxID=648752 RepID=A0A927N6J1_9ACTN|nr:DNA-binding protein [Actinopolymorpha pittospori]MBE1609882.1 hypothetical protein [Actinopolymorpha pittospori]